MPGQDRDEFRRIRPPLWGELIRLRAPEEEDLARINELLWDPDVTQNLSAAWPEPVAGTRDWVRRSRERGDHTFVIETLAGELIGGCGLDSPGPGRSAELGIWLAKAYWGQGYGTDAVRTLCRFGFREMNLARIELHVHETNPRGVRAYEKAGFRKEGKLRSDAFVGGRRVDALIMGLLAGELIEAG